MASAAECQARLNIELENLLMFFEESEVQEHSILNMKELIEQNLINDCLSLAEGFGQCMAFINHEDLLTKLLSCYSVLLDGVKLERKQTGKKLGLLREDKKVDPDVLAKWEGLMDGIELRLSSGKVEYARLKAMEFLTLDKFKDPTFDYKQAYYAEKERIKILMDPKAQYLKSKNAEAA